MASLDFLQEYDFGVELGDGILKGQDAGCAPDGGHAFVDIVGSDTNLHRNILTASCNDVAHKHEVDAIDERDGTEAAAAMSA